jgi:hypothetical protein
VTLRKPACRKSDPRRGRRSELNFAPALPGIRQIAPDHATYDEGEAARQYQAEHCGTDHDANCSIHAARNGRSVKSQIACNNYNRDDDADDGENVHLRAPAGF